jgi:O-antigen ligase
MISNLAMTIPVRVGVAQRFEYPLAFWCLVFFTFIVFVAPQALFGFLEPLHLAKVSAILALSAYMCQSVSRGEPLLPKTPEIRLLGLFIFLTALSIPSSLWRGGSFGLLTDFYAKSVIVFLLTTQLLTTLPRFERMLWFVLLFCVAVSFIAIASYQQGNLVGGYRMQGGWGGINSNPNDFALTINLFLPFGFALYSLNRTLLRKVFCAFFVVISVAAIMLTYSRGGFITLVVVLILCFLKMGRQGKRSKHLLPFMLVVIAFILLAPHDYLDRLQTITDFSKDRSGSGQARQEAIEKTLEVISEHPLLGIGMGMNGLALNAKGLYWAYVHNVYLQIASEIGIAALIVFVALILRLLKATRRIQTQFQGNQHHRKLILLARATEISLSAFCIAALFHPIAYHFYFYYIAAFALALKGIAEGVSDDPESHDRPGGPWMIRGGEFRKLRGTRVWTRH